MKPLLLILLITAFAAHYDQYLHLPPTSIHQWRQSDGLALSLHYAQNPDFGAPTQFNLFQIGDAQAVGELPLLYWLSGLLTRWGVPGYPLRWIGLSLLLAGMYAFGWMLWQLSKQPWVAALGAGLLISSPMLAYYGPGFMPDAPAFSLILLMGACLMRADQTQKANWLWLAALCAMLAMMLKISLAIVPLALSASWFCGTWKGSTLWNSRQPALAAAVTFGAVALCRWWISDYNATHQAHYFFADIRPIWWYNWTAIKDILKGIVWFGMPAYASAGLYLAVFGSLWFWVKHWRSTPFIWHRSILLVEIGCFLYLLLWFRMLREHDYYAICLMVLPALIMLQGIGLAIKQLGEKTVVRALAVCWLLGLWHCHYILEKRLQLAFHPANTLTIPPNAFLAKGELSKAGIPETARFICPEDPSPNIALSALQRHGWTNYNFGNQITVDTLQHYANDYHLQYLALRDTTDYTPLYRQFFPVKQLTLRGWHIYRH